MHPSITTVIKTFEKTRSLQSTKRSGRPRIFTHKDAKYAYLLARRSPRASYRELIASMPSHCHTSTLRRLLQRHYLRKWKAQKRIPLSIDDRKACVAAVREFLRNEYDLNRVSYLEDAPLPGLANAKSRRSSRTSLPSKMIAMHLRAGSGAFPAKNGMTGWLIPAIM